MDPNEWGDILAGVFSPLAFLWFLYTALAQRAELRLQHAELQNNTRAQDAQEEQMQRQANALDAQVQRLRAAADAQYQPILVLTTSASGGPGRTMIHLRNHGAPILDACVLENGTIAASFTPEGRIAATVRGSVLPHWPSGISVQIVLDDAARAVDGDEQDRIFEVRMTRLDLGIYVHRYYYMSVEQRVVLESVRGELSVPRT